ncbi:MAG: polymer-forming cytoskeletal protein [Chromatiales bacterium]|nr:polymer-forming cytoskeletal protein [Chromatiales bacterium]
MFRRKNNRSIEVTKLSSLVADNMAITGDVTFSAGLRVDGRIDGNVVSEDGTSGLLVLSEKGSINGSVRTWDAVINGTIRGDLEVGHFLELQANARVTGNITYRQMQLECGAAVEGKLVFADGNAAQASPGNPKAVRDPQVLELPGPPQVSGVTS